MLSPCVDVMCVLYSLLSAWFGSQGGEIIGDVVQVVKQSYVVARGIVRDLTQSYVIGIVTDGDCASNVAIRRVSFI